VKKIGINLLGVNSEYPGGVTAYSRGLSEGFAKLSGENYFYVFFVSKINFKYFSFLEKYKNIEIQLVESSARHGKKNEIKRILVGNFWLNFPINILSKLLTRKLSQKIDDSVDLMYVPHGPSPIFPYSKKPTIFSLHDIQHKHYPEFFSSVEQRHREYTFTRACKLATGIQASSRQMKDDFISAFDSLNESNVRIIPEGVDLDFFSSKSDFWVGNEIHEILDSNYIYMPAQLWPHKNHGTVLSAFAKLKLRNSDLKLILTGAPYGAYAQVMKLIDDLKLHDEVKYLGIVDREIVKILYQRSLAVLTASLYESNSLPMLEGAACGAALIAGDTPSNLELAQELRVNIFKNEDADDLVNVILSMSANSNKMSAEYNLKIIYKYEWIEIARKYEDWFGELLQAGRDFKINPHNLS